MKGKHGLLLSPDILPNAPDESAFRSSVEGIGLHVEGEGNMSRV